MFNTMIASSTSPFCSRSCLTIKVISWFSANYIQDLSIHRTMQSKADAFVESNLRADMPKLRSRMEKEKEVNEKRDKKLTKAMAT